MTLGEPPTVDDQSRTRRRIMRRVLTVYLALYFTLLAGAVVTVWRSGLISHFDRTWTVVAITFSVAMGLVLAGLFKH